MSGIESEAEDELTRNRDVFAETVRSSRKAKGFTQRKLGELCGGVSPSCIWSIEQIGRAPHPPTCRRLAAILDLNVPCFLDLASQAKKPRKTRQRTPGFRPRKRRTSVVDTEIQQLFEVVQSLPVSEKQHVVQGLKDLLNRARMPPNSRSRTRKR
jgi:transcriptional regulator with XRE-family HTH domain